MTQFTQLCKPCLNKWELLAVLVLPRLPSIRDAVNEDDGYWLPFCTSNLTAPNLVATALSGIYVINASISRVLLVYNTIWYVTRLAQVGTDLPSLTPPARVSCFVGHSHALTLRYTNLTPLPTRARAWAKPHPFMCFAQRCCAKLKNWAYDERRCSTEQVL